MSHDIKATDEGHCIVAEMPVSKYLLVGAQLAILDKPKEDKSYYSAHNNMSVYVTWPTM